MRISDWSSDVCSSDLDGGQIVAEAVDAVETGSEGGAAMSPLVVQDDPVPQSHEAPGHRGPQLLVAGPAVHEHDQRDRKSVVEGKRVSVRVDFGGSPIIKQKQYLDNINTQLKI